MPRHTIILSLKLSVVSVIAILLVCGFGSFTVTSAGNIFNDARKETGDKCGTPSADPTTENVIQQLISRFRADNKSPAKKSPQLIPIPVYVHVITASNGNGNVSDAEIGNQIAVLNNSFSGATGGVDTSFGFSLISIDRTARDDWFNASRLSPEEVAMKSNLRRGGANALNIYLNNLSPELGHAAFPWQYIGNRSQFLDGIVCRYTTLPGGASCNGCNEGDTVVHEAGHWLGLYHTFEGGCSIPNDYVDDTAPEDSPASGCPIGRNSCPLPGNDPIDNFMDYSEDTCINKYTQGQADRMIASYSIWREPPVDFKISGNPIVQMISAGETANYSIRIFGRGKQAARLTLTGLPPNSSHSFSPATIGTTPNFRQISTLTISTTPTTPEGIYTLTVSGEWLSARSSQIILRVQPPHVWAMSGNNPQRTGQSYYIGPNVTPTAPSWIFNTGTAIIGDITVSSEGNIYFASDRLYALRPDGSTLVPPVFTPTILSSPAIDDRNGFVYVNAANTMIGGWDLIRYNKQLQDATLIHHGNFPYNALQPTSIIVGYDGSVYLSDGVSLIVKNPNFNRTIAISGCFGNPGILGPAVGRDGTVYVICNSGGGAGVGSGIYKFDVLTSTQLGYAPYSRGGVEPIIDYQNNILAGYMAFNGITFFGAYSKWDSNLFLIQQEQSGDPNHFTSGRVTLMPDGTSSVRWSYSFGGERILSSRGSQVWNISSQPPTIFRSLPTTDAEGKIYIGSDSSIMCLSPNNGSTIWSFPIANPVITQPVISKQGKLYVGTSDGKVYAF